ncbi:alkaline phosphatase family protein, partial [Planctomycetota bacterium]
LWELADRAGKRVISLNLPVSSPPPKVNGIIIPGLLCPELSPATVHPPQAYDRYIKPRKDYLIVNKDPQDTVRGYAEQALAAERVRLEVARELMDQEQWDIFYLQIQGSDPLQHKVWWALDPKAKGYDPQEHAEALAFYRGCDEIIGEIVKAPQGEVLTLIVSDHGFCGLESTVGVNVWLRQHEYLHLRAKEPANQWEATKTQLKNKIPPAKALAGCYGRVRQRMSDFLGRRLKGRGRTPLFCELDMVHMRRVIDFEKTRAFCLGALGGMLYINATPPQRRELGLKLTEQLLAELGPESPQPVIDAVKTGAQVYGEDCDPDLLPDLVLEYREGVIARINTSGDDVVLTGLRQGRQPGTHSRMGVYVAQGPGIHSGKKFAAEIVDITPTVLAYLDLPIPRHMDGKILEKAFIEPPEIKYEDVAFKDAKSTGYTDEEQAAVEKHLADLGYL